MTEDTDLVPLVDSEMLKPNAPTKLKTEDPQPARTWSRTSVIAFWVGAALVIGALAYIGIRSLTEIHGLESGQRSLLIDIDNLANETGENVTSLTTSIEMLQTLVNQSALTVTVNGTTSTLMGPGVAVTLTTPGYGMVYRSVPDPDIFLSDLAWDYALWDDAAYWSAGQPGLVFPPATGRYAVGLNCPKCCQLDTTTAVEGTVTVVYSTTTEPELHCPRVIAIEDVRATNPTDTIPAVNIYAEFELTAGTGEFLAVEANLNYAPSKPVLPQGGPDNCIFTVRYLGRATGTPMVPQICLKRDQRGANKRRA